jgi:hypothetical protein
MFPYNLERLVMFPYNLERLLMFPYNLERLNNDKHFQLFPLVTERVRVCSSPSLSYPLRIRFAAVMDVSRRIRDAVIIRVHCFEPRSSSSAFSTYYQQ